MGRQEQEAFDGLYDDHEALLKAVRLMRDAQKAYFKLRSDENLKAAKAHEARVDKLIEPVAPTNQIPLPW